ncbi:hypothetical protein PanWU01x14_364990 [Parasponia andersonii]|uniref:Uncharacterized protein n=1 Tax=Parasponia andersonii TaxID=3476 RepID=A0A2P5A649_PARAD|nr:hypothetical protein PanWU01x14_364990 [Parasponia andersonii]
MTVDDVYLFLKSPEFTRSSFWHTARDRFSLSRSLARSQVLRLSLSLSSSVELAGNASSESPMRPFRRQNIILECCCLDSRGT